MASLIVLVMAVKVQSSKERKPLNYIKGWRKDATTHTIYCSQDKKPVAC